ncbi:MAG: ABC transporter permease [Flammeovirgaceae bacterium]|nr:ABC transporter permease [Flammeovirgaceae bacterium]MBE61218.1 ABC transporter permease [Flammeovirgaceae bacterium]MBR07113.1 ABC transporter permease [Rickettsiales bacterium]HCX24818.1 ABC transporter permease [Cytophagales bacterium]|tara:strand:- start:11613 stop:12395 length:783 start_codon:yes stop_codon:yes gene_type:complete
MIKIFKYSFSDLIRSRWSFIYLAFYLLLGFVLLFLNNDLSKGIITLMNVIVVLTPMIGTIFGVMYYYNSREFTELLLAQPVKRSVILLGQYLGISISLSLSLIIGLGIPFLAYGLFRSGEIVNFLLLLISGTFLTFIFVALAICIALFNSNKIKGFGYAILMWLFFAVIYDGLILLSMMILADYPLDNYALIASFLNPIDLSRIMILLKLDISALLGYTGALFQQFFGTPLGLIASWSMLMLWTIFPTVLLIRKAQTKNF